MKRRGLLLLLLLGSTACQPANDLAMYPVIPQPETLTPRAGMFPLTAETTLVLANPADENLQALGGMFQAMMGHTTGIQPALSTASSTGAVVFTLDPNSDQPDEGYHLSVAAQTVSLSAKTHAGLFYGMQTLHQLMQSEVSDNGAVMWKVPAVEIEDAPRFAYRGMHLDVGRHMFPVAFIKTYIDLLATFKMNRFHWHLTEDQGWRIEIKKYPKLTEVAAFRKETILEKNFDPYIGDGQPYGGFYTQDEVREIVAYAAARYITIIPEIEMPGHSLAALAAYPELACTDGPFEVGTVWGVYEDIYCPSEATFAFLEDVLREVMDLFPSTYLHIGGDEAPKKRWEESALAQAVIDREGLADTHELQSYFIKRIERFLLTHGRRLIGWDEILEGGLAPEATVMSWRGMAGGIAAAQQGHDVIMTPTSHCYFDYYQGDPETEPLAIGGFTPLDKVYAFEPIPEELTPEEARHILGAQGNVWTEYMKTPEHVAYMVLPRMLALAEVVWSPATARDFVDFKRRLPPHLARLEAQGIKYRPLDEEAPAEPEE